MSEDKVQVLAERLRRLRAAHGWSIRKAAAQAGISPQYLSGLERAAPSRWGKPLTPKPPILRRLAGAYGIAYTDLASIMGYTESSADPVATEAEEILADLERNPDLRVIHKSLRGMPPEQLKAWVAVMRTLVPATQEDQPPDE